jgi:hypothetical protein
MPDMHTDGNGVAGLLTELMAGDPTAAERRCHSCGASTPVAAHLAYEGAGTVLRCPACGDVALRVCVQEEHLVYEWRGTFRVRRAG